MTRPGPALEGSPLADAIARLSAALAHRYRIERELGQGGMATVHLAQDLKHDREVAIKVLKPELAAVLGADRFVQEIKTTAALQHPHILPLFDSGSADGFLYYVMPYIEGETLRTKLDREKQLGVDEAVKITTEVADALDYAHRHSVIHRDIKPENILLHDGRPMVADFGIALAVSAAAGGRMTETGLSLGTPHYMSPEQATADRDITARSDIYSLASVLYEMLTGEPPHMGTSAQQIIMKIVTEEAQPVTRLRKSVPPNVVAAVGQALEKLPADRFATAKEFAEGLLTPTFRTTGGREHALHHEVEATNRRHQVILGSMLLVSLGVALMGWLRRPTDRGSPPTQFDVELPGSVTSDPVVSPDGRVVVYGADDGSGPVLYRRALDQSEAVKLAGTEGGEQPFFSPDGLWIGFIAHRRLQKVSTNGGGPVTIAEVPSMVLGADWGPMDSIVLALYTGLGLVPSSGGAVARLAIPDSLGFPAWPQFVGSGNRVLLTLSSASGTGDSRAAIYDRVENSIRVLGTLGNATGVRHLPNGDLLYVLKGRSGESGPDRLYRVPTDNQSLQPIGPPEPLPWAVHSARPGADSAVSLAFAASRRTLVTAWASGASRRVLVWVSHAGVETPIDTGDYDQIRLSPDGRFLAANDAIHDLERPNVLSAHIGGSTPIWTPGGRRVVYSAGADLRWVANEVGANSEVLLAGGGQEQFPHSFSPDGSVLAFYRIDPERARDIYLLPMTGNLTPVPYLVTAANERSPEFAPDGRWIAYTSDVSGVDEVYVRPYPGPGQTTPVSVGGGREPLWSSDGRFIYYRGRGQVLQVAVHRVAGTIGFGEPVPLFRDQYDKGFPWSGMRLYDLARDGRFIMHRSATKLTVTMRITEHWLGKIH